jgi:hypothetical protein
MQLSVPLEDVQVEPAAELTRVVSAPDDKP